MLCYNRYRFTNNCSKRFNFNVQGFGDALFDLRYHCLNQLNKSDLTIEVRNLLKAGLYITNLAGSGNADTMWLFQILQVTFQLISNY